MMMSVELSVGWELVRETEVLGENVPHCCPQQIPCDLTWARTRAAVMGSPKLKTEIQYMPLIFFLLSVNKFNP
jgi:hypothetical protein